MTEDNRSIIIDTLRKANRPMKLAELSLITGLTMQSLNLTLEKLVKAKTIEVFLGNEKVDKYEAKFRYFSLIENIEPTLDTSINDFMDKYKTISNDLKQQYVDFAEDITEKSSIIENKVNDLELQTKNIYSNLMSIMGIFVALFSMIIINTEAISKFISSEDQLHDIFFKLSILNIPIILCIITLMLCIRFIILNPLIKKEKKNSTKDNIKGNK